MGVLELAGKYAIARERHEPLQELEEVLVQTIPAGQTLAASGSSLPQVLIQTGGAIAGGFTLGVLGKKIGARIGKAIHKDPLQDQRSFIAGLGRTLGQETLQQGLQQQMAHTKGVIKQQLKEETSAALLNEALQNPERFAGKYGVNPEDFKKYHEAAKAASKARATLETIENLPHKAKQEFIKQQQAAVDPVFTQIEELIGTQSAESLDERLQNVAKRAKAFKVDVNNPQVDTLEFLKKQVSDVAEGMLTPPVDVTGEHIGRAIGRYAGDEIGIAVGLGLGGMASNALGFKSEKDQKIKELEEQLARINY